MKRTELDKIDYYVSQYGKNDNVIRNELTINENLRALRKYVGLTQNQLAEFIYENVKLISRIESGSEIRVEVLKKMRPYLGFSYEKLLMGISPTETKSKIEYGINSDVLKWLSMQDKNSNALATLNLLFSTGIIDDILSAVKNYIHSGYLSNRKDLINNENRTIPQYEVVDIIKNKSVVLIKKALEQISDRYHIVENRKEIIIEEMIRQELGDMDSKIYKLNKMFREKQMKCIIEDNISFENDIAG